jgi:hypothetical protein
MKHTYLLTICCVGTLYCMEKELLTHDTHSQNSLEIPKKIEKTRAAYDNLSYTEQKGCCNSNSKAVQYEQRLDALSKQKKEAKTDEKELYIDISQYPITVDNNTGAHTLSISKDNSSDSTDSDSSGYVLLKGFKAMHRDAWKNLTEVNICNMNLGWLPLHKFVVACPHLAKLDASRNKIEGLSYHKTHSPYNIKNNQGSLTDLNLSYNNLSAVDSDKLFILCPYIKDLDLSHNNSLHALKMTRNLPCRATKRRSYCDPICDPTGGTSLPRIHIYNTALTEETKNKLKQRYINTITNAYAELYGANGFVIGAPFSFALACIYAYGSFGPRSGAEILGAVIGLQLGTELFFHIAGRIIGWGRTYCAYDSVEKYAENHIIQSEQV